MTQRGLGSSAQEVREAFSSAENEEKLRDQMVQEKEKKKLEVLLSVLLDPA